VREIVGWYSQQYNAALGDAANIDVDAMEQSFRALAKRHGVSDDIVISS
jgi:hypothetical protein